MKLTRRLAIVTACGLLIAIICSISVWAAREDGKKSSAPVRTGTKAGAGPATDIASEHSGNKNNAVQTQLIVGVNTQRLLDLTDLKGAIGTAQNNGVWYASHGKTIGLAMILVNVLPSIEAGREAFASDPSPNKTAKVDRPPGDEFMAWTEQFEDEGKKTWTSTCLLRRKNVVLFFVYGGVLENLIKIARRVDKELISSDLLAPKGRAVTIPTVQISAPTSVPQGRAEVPIKVISTKGVPIRVEAEHTTASGRLGEAARFAWYKTDKLGEQKINILMATEGNVVFSKTVSIKVVTPAEYESSRTLRKWSLPNKALFFVREAGAKWHEVPDNQREWIVVARLTESLFRDLDIAGVDDANSAGQWTSIEVPDRIIETQEQALQNWKEAIKPDWLPDTEMIDVASLERPDGRFKFAHCAFSKQSFQGLYFGTVNKSFWLYIEQPDPLPKGTAPIMATDIVRSDIFQTTSAKSGEKSQGVETSYPRVEFLSRTFTRYRAFKPQGPYQRVRVLLIRFRFPQEVNLRSPGYP